MQFILENMLVIGRRMTIPGVNPYVIPAGTAML